ncbi:MAG TPA: CotH kinase family protein [Pyrinomonadaceae bacterium]
MSPNLFGALIFAVLLTSPTAYAQTWPDVFNPFQLLTLNLELAPADWDTIRRDTTNEIEVPARFWADGEPTSILVSVRRKSSRALPSEADPRKVGLKIDINEFVDGQKWRDLTKLSLENGTDSGVVEEGFAWNLHRLAAPSNGYQPAYASWVQLRVNGELLGVYVSAEQRDKQMLRNRGLWFGGETWIYDQEDISTVEIEEGESHSPTYNALCYSPFRNSGGKRSTDVCATPGDAALAADLPLLVNMNGLLTQGAVDAYTDNPDALLSHGKNFQFVDFIDLNGTGRDTRRLYFPWDLDAVFRSTSGSIYGSKSGRKIVTSPYQEVVLRHPLLRAQYNQIMLDLLNGPLSVSATHAFLDQAEAALAEALANDPYPTNDGEVFGRLRHWTAARDVDIRIQLAANGPPLPRN